MPIARTTARWETLIVALYGPHDSRPIADTLAAMVARRRAGMPAAGGQRTGALTERDVILIVYPDQIQTEGSSPLPTLADFCETRLQGIIRHLHILPFYPSSSDDGFSVIDYRQVDPGLGTWADISRLASSFGLMTDAVLNHASVRSVWFQAFLRGEEPYRNYFIEYSDPAGLENVARPRTSPLLHRLGSPPAQKTVWTTFSADQADLNYRNARVLLEAADLLMYYADRGASILRLDAAAYLWKTAGTRCINLPQTHLLLQLLRAILDEAAPGVLLAAETNVAHAENIAYAGDGGNEAHLIYNFALPPLVLHTFLAGDADPLSRWAGTLAFPGGTAAFINFLASHDGIGLNGAREILSEAELQALVRKTQDHGGYVSFRRQPDGALQPYELNINYFDALSTPFSDEPLETQIRRFLGAHAILLSLAGIPALYFHSLFGSRGWREGVEQSGIKRAVNRRKVERDAFEHELADVNGIRHRVFSALSSMIRIRVKTPAFDPFAPQQTAEYGKCVFALWRTSPKTGQRVLCLQEVTGTAQVLPVGAGRLFGPLRAGQAVTDLISGRRLPSAAADQMGLDPYQSLWLTLCEDPPQLKMERADTA